MSIVREMTAMETADALRDYGVGFRGMTMGNVMNHAAILLKEQAAMLQEKSEQIRNLVREKVDLQQANENKNKPVDPEVIRALGFLEGIAFGIEDDTLYESVKDALEKISGVLKQGG